MDNILPQEPMKNSKSMSKEILDEISTAYDLAYEKTSNALTRHSSTKYNSAAISSLDLNWPLEHLPIGIKRREILLNYILPSQIDDIRSKFRKEYLQFIEEINNLIEEADILSEFAVCALDPTYAPHWSHTLAKLICGKYSVNDVYGAGRINSFSKFLRYARKHNSYEEAWGNCNDGEWMGIVCSLTRTKVDAWKAPDHLSDGDKMHYYAGLEGMLTPTFYRRLFPIPPKLLEFT